MKKTCVFTLALLAATVEADMMTRAKQLWAEAVRSLD